MARYHVVVLDPLAIEGGPIALPAEFVGLDRASLADLSSHYRVKPEKPEWMGPDDPWSPPLSAYLPGPWEKRGLWPVVEVRPPTGAGERNADTPAYEIDAEAREVREVYAVEAKPLAELKAAKVAAVNARRDTVLDLGAPFGGRRIKVDDGARADLGGMGATALAVLITAATEAPIAWPANYALGWIALDNARVAMPTPAVGLALGVACGGFYAAAVQNARTLKDRALASASADELAAVDLDSGWPE